MRAQLAFEYFKERVETYSKRGLTDGFRRIDTDHKGSLQGEELKKFFMEDAHCPWFVNDNTINVLVDFADLNNDDSIGYLELSNVLLCDDIIAFAALVPNKKGEAQLKKDNEMKIGSRGCTVGQVRECQQQVTMGLINRGSGDLRQNNLRSVLTYLDVREDGVVTRDELKSKLKLINVLEHMTPEKKKKGVVKEVSSRPRAACTPPPTHAALHLLHLLHITCTRTRSVVHVLYTSRRDTRQVTV